MDRSVLGIVNETHRLIIESHRNAIFMFQQSTHRSGTVVTLEDLWLSCTLLHVVCVLLVDLALPARRIRYAVVVDNAWESKSSGKCLERLDEK